MKWEHETWRKLYVRVTAKWLLLPLSARGLGDELLKYCDDDGVIPIGSEDPGEAIARLTSAHRHELKRVVGDVADLIKDGFLVHDGTDLRVRNLKIAQERTGSAARMAKKRALDRYASHQTIQAGVTVTGQVTVPVTSRSDGSHARGSVPFRSEIEERESARAVGSPETRTTGDLIRSLPELAAADPDQLAGAVEGQRMATGRKPEWVLAAIRRAAMELAGVQGLSREATNRKVLSFTKIASERDVPKREEPSGVRRIVPRVDEPINTREESEAITRALKAKNAVPVPIPELP